MTKHRVLMFGCACALVSLVAGCSRSHRRPDLTSSASADAGVFDGATATAIDGSVPITVAPAVHVLPAAVDEQAESTQPAHDDPAVAATEIEVWVGELHDGSIISVDSPAAPETATRDAAAVFVLRRDSAGEQIAGSAAFGDASHPPTLAALSKVGPEGFDATLSLIVPFFWGYARSGIVTGFEYTMLAVKHGEAQLSFTISGAELWRQWCCQPDGSYACPPEVKAPFYLNTRDSDSRRLCAELPPTLSFNMRIDGDMMEGSIQPAADGWDAVPVIRLRRVD